jgi:hypothetical protein
MRTSSSAATDAGIDRNDAIDRNDGTPAIDERARHELFVAVENHLGSSHADTLMSLWPPVGWADVATKHDLDELEARVALRFERVDDRFDVIDQRFSSLDDRFNMFEVKVIGAMATMVSMCLSAIALLR